MANETKTRNEAEQILNGWASEEGNFHEYAINVATAYLAAMPERVRDVLSMARKVVASELGCLERSFLPEPNESESEELEECRAALDAVDAMLSQAEPEAPRPCEFCKVGITAKDGVHWSGMHYTNCPAALSAPVELTNATSDYRTILHAVTLPCGHTAYFTEPSQFRRHPTRNCWQCANMFLRC